MKKLLILILLLILGISSNAQQSISSNFILGDTFLRGVYSGDEIIYQRGHTTYSISYLNLDNLKVNNNTVFGKNINLTYGYYTKLFTIDSLVDICINPNIGVAYLSKTFYNTDNLNTIVGSRLNAIMQFKVLGKIRLYKGLYGEAGISIDHKSNLSIQVPNNSLNSLSRDVSLSLNLSNTKIKARTFNIINSNILEVEAIQGFTSPVKTGYFINPNNNKGMYPDTIAVQGKSNKLYREAINISYLQGITNILNLKVGTDWIYQSDILDYNQFFKTKTSGYNTYHHLNVGTSIGADIRYNRFVFTGSVGTLVTNGFYVYKVVSLSYYITPNLSLEAKSYLSNFGGIGIKFKIYHHEWNKRSSN